MRHLLAILLSLAAVCGVKAQTSIVTDEGAWCWFADPRALHYENASGTINATWLGYIDVHGNVKATQYDWVGGRKADVLIRSYFQPDDHNNPTLVVLPDERVMIFYTRHTDEAKIWYRISRRPGDITDLGEEKSLATANNTTYPSPFILSDDPTHIYLCWRGINWHPTIARITMPDANGDCQFDFGPKQIVQSTGARPYAKYASNGKDKIYLTYTTGHPDNEMPDWLYINVIDINGGNGPILRDITGTQLSVINNGVFNVKKTSDYASSYPMTIVDNSDGIRNWVWQIALDNDENPVIAYPQIDDAKTSHHYWYARWTGTQWRRTWVQQGGHAFHQNWNATERCYSGGMSIDPDNINDLYLSVPTKNGQYNKDGVYEIWKYTIDDNGDVTASQQITSGSTKNNVRPFVFPGSKNSPMRLAWMNGDYYYWMVQKNYPLGYPTDVRVDYTWPETANEGTANEGFTLAAGTTLVAAFAMDQDNYGGTLLQTADGTFAYSLDATSQHPSITINGTTYTSQNSLLTSDNWATNSTGTSGDNWPTKLQTWVLTLTYDGQRLTTYRNGFIDQVVTISNLSATDITFSGDGFNHTCLSAKTYNLAATPLTAMTLSARAENDATTQLPEYALQAISLPATTSTDLVLPTTSMRQTITWTSGNTDVLTATGLLTFPEAATTVRLTATCGTATRDFDIEVQPRDITRNLRYTQDTPLDQTANTTNGFDTNTFGLAPEGLLTGLRSYTFLAKINAKTMTKQPRIYDFGSGSGNSIFLRANPLAAGIKYNGGTTTLVNGATTLQAGKDYALAVTFDAATKTTRIFIDGEEDAAGTANQAEPYQLATIAADTRNYIGRTQWWDGEYKNDNQDFCGTISDLRLYDVALTKKEICQLQDLPYNEPSTELVNGDFEGTYTVQSGSGVRSDRAIYVPIGWTVNRNNPDVNDITALKDGDLSYSSFASNPKPSDSSTQTYWIRQKWGSSTLTLSQTVLLPEGTYTLTCDLWKSGLGGDAFITATPEGGNQVKSASLENKTEWQQASLEFNSDGITPITIALVAQHTSDGSEKIIGFDNVTIVRKEIVIPDPGPEPTVEPIDEWAFRLKNTCSFDRTAETVEVTVPAGLNLATSQLQTESGTDIPFEITADGRARFQATVPANATAGYRFAPGTHTTPQQKLTYAAIKGDSRADIAWENDLNAYRMYSSSLLSSEPNTAQGVDVWYKKQSTPIIDAMFNTNWHNENQYGVDAYSVNGKRLGCGGTAAVVDGHLVMHDPYTTCTVTENNNLGSAFTLVYDNVAVGAGTYTKTLHVQTSAGTLLSQATVRLDGPQQPMRLAVAIYEHTDMNLVTDGVDFTDVPGLIGRAENKSEGDVTSAAARFYQGAYVPSAQPSGLTVNPSTEVIDNHLCLVVDYTPGTELTFWFGGGWNIFPAGRYASDTDWFSQLEQFKQCVDAPLTATSFHTLPMKDDVLTILNTVNQTWQQRNPTHGDYFWNRAVYHIGNMEAYAATGLQQYLDFSTAWATRNNWCGSTGTDKSKWKYTYGEGSDFVLFGDNQVCFQVYADLYNIDPDHAQNKIARAREVMEYEISTANTDYLWWVDGLFMVMPVMSELYKITGNQTYLDKMYAYWQYANSIMYDEETGLYFRDAKYVYPAHTTDAGKKDFWARGDGWIFAAFARVLADLPATDSHRDEYIAYYRRMAAALKSCQQPEGYWTRSLLDTQQAPGYETSGTALNAYAYAAGIRMGILDEVEYGYTLQQAWNYLSTIALQSDGTVGYIQPIGESASPGTTVNATSYHDFGVGAYLMAAAEISRLAAGQTAPIKLRLANASIAEANEILITFNAEPNPTEATDPANYIIKEMAGGQFSIVHTPSSISPLPAGEGPGVRLLFPSPLPYGRYSISVQGIHSGEGGEMAEGQTRTILRTVPLSAAPSGISVTAIGAQDGNPAKNVLDNNLGTRWSQQGTSGQWLQIDLGTDKDVQAVDIAVHNGTSRKSYFDIQTSSDGTTFETAMAGLESSGMTNELERYRLPQTTTARYVRIVCNGTSVGDWNSITEVRVSVAGAAADELQALSGLPAETWSDIFLPDTTAQGRPITWTSSDPAILSSQGYVHPLPTDQTVRLTATVDSDSRDFDIIVRARDITRNLRYEHEPIDQTTNTPAGFGTNTVGLAPDGLLAGLRSYTFIVTANARAIYNQPRVYDFGSGSGNSVFLRFDPLAAGVKYKGGTTTLVSADATLQPRTNYQLAVTYDASTHTTRIYVNGIQHAQGLQNTIEPYLLAQYATDTRNYIGRTQWWDNDAKANNQDFCGTISGLQLYNICLTQDEIRDLQGLRGDVDGNGTIDNDDLLHLLNIILGNETDNNATADINHDNSVTIADVTTLINIIANK